MSRRRVSSPQTTQQLWDAIRITSYQRQIPDINRITRYMSRIHGVSEGLLAYLYHRILYLALSYLIMIVFLEQTYPNIFFTDEVRRQLSYCVRDGLIRLVKRVGYKGTKIGVEQESYRLPKPKILVSLW